MHTTVVTLKDGTVIKGPIGIFRPAFNWFTLYGNDKKICFDDCISVITPNERCNVNSPPEGEPHDLMKAAAQTLVDGRQYGWTEEGMPYPKKKWDWEKKMQKKTCNK